jgi:hypothetical protein
MNTYLSLAAPHQTVGNGPNRLRSSDSYDSVSINPSAALAAFSRVAVRHIGENPMSTHYNAGHFINLAKAEQAASHALRDDVLSAWTAYHVDGEPSDMNVLLTDVRTAYANSAFKGPNGKPQPSNDPIVRRIKDAFRDVAVDEGESEKPVRYVLKLARGKSVPKGSHYVAVVAEREETAITPLKFAEMTREYVEAFNRIRALVSEDDDGEPVEAVEGIAAFIAEIEAVLVTPGREVPNVVQTSTASVTEISFNYGTPTGDGIMQS